jgi:hypothetical protein
MTARYGFSNIGIIAQNRLTSAGWSVGGTTNSTTGSHTHTWTPSGLFAHTVINTAASTSSMESGHVHSLGGNSDAVAFGANSGHSHTIPAMTHTTTKNTFAPNNNVPASNYVLWVIRVK